MPNKHPSKSIVSKPRAEKREIEDMFSSFIADIDMLNAYKKNPNDFRKPEMRETLKAAVGRVVKVMNSKGAEQFIRESFGLSEEVESDEKLYPDILEFSATVEKRVMGTVAKKKAA
jgi:hypothetical protein